MSRDKSGHGVGLTKEGSTRSLSLVDTVYYIPREGMNEALLEVFIQRPHGHARLLLPFGLLIARFGAIDETKIEMMKSFTVHRSKIYADLAEKISELAEWDTYTAQESDFGI